MAMNVVGAGSCAVGGPMVDEPFRGPGRALDRGRGPGHERQPGRRLRLPGRGARDRRSHRGRVSGPARRGRRDRGGGRGRRRAAGGPLERVRGRPRARPGGGPRRRSRRARVAGPDAQPDPAGPRASGRRRRRRSAACWLEPPWRGRRCGAERALALATEIEGHPDNAAAALLGGFTIAAHGDRAEAIRFDIPRDLRAVLFIPDLRLATDEMRAALPESVPAGRRGGEPAAGRPRRGRRSRRAAPRACAT